MVLEDGSAAEVGNHRELMEKNGVYAEMFRSQQLEAAVGEKKAALERHILSVGKEDAGV